MPLPPSFPRELALFVFAALALVALGTATLLQRALRTSRRQVEELEARNRVLAAANREQKQFLANVSHELRTPLSAMLGYVEMLTDGAFGPLPTGARGSLERIDANARLLLRLTGDFLDLSRLEANRLSLQMEIVPLAPVCAEAIELVKAQLEVKPVDLILEIPESVSVEADRDRLRQVLVNLLSNAIKFTEKGSIRVRATTNSAGKVRIEVADTGVGIAPAEQELIFEPFRRGNHATAIGGVGIGLTLSRQLTEAMGGTIGVESVPGQGATFSVQLNGSARG